MLIDKPISVNDIVALKLSTQEEIIGKVVDLDSKKLTLHKVMTISLGMDERTMKPGIQMLPFFLLGADPDSKITIDNEHIVARAPANADIKKSYISATSSLTIPSSNTSGIIK